MAEVARRVAALLNGQMTQMCMEFYLGTWRRVSQILILFVFFDLIDSVPCKLMSADVLR